MSKGTGFVREHYLVRGQQEKRRRRPPNFPTPHREGTQPQAQRDLRRGPAIAWVSLPVEPSWQSVPVDEARTGCSAPDGLGLGCQLFTGLNAVTEYQPP